MVLVNLPAWSAYFQPAFLSHTIQSHARLVEKAVAASSDGPPRLPLVDLSIAFKYHQTMSLIRRVFSINPAAFLLLALTFPFRASAVPAAVPEPFSLFLSAPGVLVYGNETEEGAEEYVQLLDLNAGAQLAFWHGPIQDAGHGEGQFGGASPRIERHYLPDMWPMLQTRYPEMVCLANGQFFRDTVNGMWLNPTQLAFPLKSDGIVISEGYERRRFRQQRVMLEIWDTHAAIGDFSRSTFYASTAPDVIVGLEEQARVRAAEELGRTLVGVGDRDGDGRHEIVLVYSGAAATQARATSVLREFGAQEIMILDGGGSAQLSCEGASYIKRVRPLPQMIATVAADSQQAGSQEAGSQEPVANSYLTLFEKTLARWLRLLDVMP